jgi:hypothetical protein
MRSQSQRINFFAPLRYVLRSEHLFGFLRFRPLGGDPEHISPRSPGFGGAENHPDRGAGQIGPPRLHALRDQQSTSKFPNTGKEKDCASSRKTSAACVNMKIEIVRWNQ